MALTEENNRRHLSNEPTFRNSHITQINESGEQDRHSAAKRYGTYELNWTSSSAESISTDDEVIVDLDDNNLNVEDSAQIVKKNLTSLKHSSLQDTRKKFSLTSNKRSHSSFGIAVTTTKVTEVLGNQKEKIFNNDSSFIIKNDMTNHSSINVEQRHSRQEKLNISSNLNVEYERRRSIPSPPPPITTQIPPPPVPQMREKSQVSFNINNVNYNNNVNHNSMQKSSFIHDQLLLQKQKNRISIGPVKSKGGKRKSLNFTKINQPELIIPRDSSFIDPRLLAKKNNYPNYSIKTQTINRKLIKREQSIRRNKLPPRNMEFAPTSNPILSNDPTDMDADLPPLKLNGLPWLPGPSKPPQLLHASLIPLPNRSQRASSSNNNRTSYISTNKPGRVSSLISSVNVKRNSINFPQSRLNRVNSSRKRVSIMIPTTRRASLIFRQQILEESLMMSFGQQFSTNSQPINSTKPLIRRKTKKGSNAKVEDREARRERRRRKEKRVKNIMEQDTFENSSNNNNLINRQVDIKMENTKKSLNELEITKPIETPELLTNKENITISQPSSRRSLNDLTTTTTNNINNINNINNLNNLNNINNNINGDSSSSSAFCSSPPDREHSPFPSHLSRSKSNQETSRFLPQRPPPPPPPHPPPLGPLPVIPILSPPPSSNLTPSPDEEYDQQLKIIDESNSINQIPPPLLSPRTQKLGILGGLFNKQSSGLPLNSPGMSNIPSSIPLSPSQSTKQQFLYPRPPSPPPINSPPQSPPLSPSRAIRLPTSRVVKPRRTNDTTPTIQDPEKLRKMEQFEALIASTEAQNNKKSKTGKIRALTTAIIPTTSNSSSSSSSSSSNPVNTYTTNSNAEKKKKKTGPYIPNGRRNSSTSSNGSDNNGEQQNNELKIGVEESRSSLTSLATSVAESVHYRPEEKNKLGKPGPTDEDGVIRVTLTPKVCR
ncbi:hypothetical protein F8M41_007795 [Gigaspora margarita]|uniref:Uncharacterized protein n=1 Tax=Gigaspora margarita TaxID=4874 RepID=A0A8H4B4A7_GIGMA|nr:hypothetical protein F8M41_007795 [Gigaspora margarita]